MAGDKHPGKGTFSRFRLPVARKYLTPSGRRQMVLLGLVAGAVVVAVLSFDIFQGRGTLVSGGPLSSAHATLSQDCASCHTGFGPVTNEACSTCHEKLGDDLGTYSFAAHYVYRSNDFQRVEAHEHEMPCATCHTEHQGRDADITTVADATCELCHERSSFAKDHPEFFTATDPYSDDDALIFPHGHHTREVMDREGFVDVEKACLYCHEPDPAGRNFEPMNFDRHCDDCHLEAGIGTPRLAVASAPEDLGVETLEAIRASGEPGTDWAFYLDPNEFRGAGSRIAKVPLHHPDPWVLHNLRRLRRLLYPNAGLADLLTASADVPASESRVLYEEALDTLEGYATGLRGSADPGIQEQLAAIEKILGKVRGVLDDPLAPFDTSEFLLALERPADLPDEDRETLDGLIDDLTAACTLCHTVERATFTRIQEDQRALWRSEFDHRAHVIQRRCLDCHNQIPILDAVSGEELDPDVDRAALHNLPAIDSCRECHQPGLAANQCTTCHLFHPDAGRHADLLLYQD